jgi:murein DD-endopeptidase MepM/ murein hydrolase activator NlpD
MSRGTKVVGGCRRCRALWVRAVLVTLVLTLALTLVGGGFVGLVSIGQPAVAAERVEYQPPVDGAVIDGWRPPEHTYGAGNRGWDLATSPGTPVRSPASGSVTFVGAVGGTVWVVIRHPDGLRSSLGPINPSVVAGARMTAGQTVGLATGSSIHWGVRQDQTYIDPGSLLRPPTGRVRLTK